MSGQVSPTLSYLADLKRLVVPKSALGHHGHMAGKIVRVSGLVLEAEGIKLPIGTVCLIEQDNFAEKVACEVVGFSSRRIFLMPHQEVVGIEPGALVYAEPQPVQKAVFGQTLSFPDANPVGGKFLPVGDVLLGRVLDANGRALDGKGALGASTNRSLAGQAINPLNRTPVRTALDVGVKAVNALLTVGKGQRLGIFAGSGVGKSVLLGMMAKYTKATRVVVGLIGERGREVKEFIEDILGPEGLARSVVVAAPADASALMRLQGAAYATTLAEQFRDEGHDVLLIMDSLTRYAMAQREIALSLGEPPATKGYPPSVFAKLPALVERAGNGNLEAGGGSITAFYTVLTEGDDQQDPIADSARAILDGHFVLSRSLAEQGHYPAIDVDKSISRVMHSIVDTQHFESARYMKAAFSRYQANRDLMAVGAYVPGADPVLDASIAIYPKIEGFVQQKMSESVSYQESLMGLGAVFPFGASPMVGQSKIRKL
jgi:flagellum-specific ATP synthase